MPRILTAVLILFSLTSCATKPAAAPAKVYAMRGVIMKIDPSHKFASIDAEKIEGWMEPMTMDYPVHDSKLLEPLKTGDHITASVHVPEDLNFWIDNIVVVQK